MARHDRFQRFTLRVTANFFGSKFAQSCQNSRRAAHGIFVEIETQSLPPAERRTIRGQVAHRVARLKHGRTSIEWTARVPAILLSWPSIPHAGQFAAIPVARVSAR